MTPEEAWRAAKVQLEIETPKSTFETWMRDTQFIAYTDGVFTISAPNEDARAWLEERVTHIICRLLTGLVNCNVKVHFITVADNNTDAEEDEFGEEPVDVSTNTVMTLEPIHTLDYDAVVMPTKVVVVPGYLKRLGREVGPRAIWLYVGFHQCAWMSRSCSPAYGLRSEIVRKYTGMSHGTFWRNLQNPEIKQNMSGLVEKVESSEKRYRRGRDGRPHRVTNRYRVFMTPRLTHGDATAVYQRINQRLADGIRISEALKEILACDIVDFLDPPKGIWPIPNPDVTNMYTVMDIVSKLCDQNPLPDELDNLAQQIHRRIINAFGKIFITHYFIQHVIPENCLTPAQAWLITIARDMTYRDEITGIVRDEVTFWNGYTEMASLVGLQRHKTIWEWLRKSDAFAPFMVEVEIPSQINNDDGKCAAAIPRRFRVMLDEPIVSENRMHSHPEMGHIADANGTHRCPEMGHIAGANGTHKVGANGTHIAGANGTDLNSLNTINTFNSTSPTSCLPDPLSDDKVSVQKVVEGWNLPELLDRCNVRETVQQKLITKGVTVNVFISWLLYGVSAQGKGLNNRVSYAISRILEKSTQGAGGPFDRLANWPSEKLQQCVQWELEYRYPWDSDWRFVMSGASRDRIIEIAGILGIVI